MGFELDRKTRQQLGYKLIDRINDFFESLPDRKLQLPSEARTFGPLTASMPELGDDAGRVLDDLCRDLVEQGFHVPAANYFGLMNPTPTYMAVMAEALVAALNPQLASMARSQLASKIENETVRWIGERVGWNVPFDGTFTSGGNEANFSALALALAKYFPSSIDNGVASIGAQPVVYASGEAHHSLDKSVGLLGLGRKALRRIPINERVQLDPWLLEQQIHADRSAGHRPFCVVATAGTTNSGAIDDIVARADICDKHRLWLHLDGAYGAAAIFSDKHRALVAGIERTDSVTIDPHKWLAMPFAAGVVLTRHPQTLRDAFEISTPYMPKIAGAALTDNFKVSTQWSRRMNSLKFYLTLRVHGRGLRGIDRPPTRSRKESRCLVRAFGAFRDGGSASAADSQFPTARHTGRRTRSRPRASGGGSDARRATLDLADLRQRTQRAAHDDHQLPHHRRACREAADGPRPGSCLREGGRRTITANFFISAEDCSIHSSDLALCCHSATFPAGAWWFAYHPLFSLRLDCDNASRCRCPTPRSANIPSTIQTSKASARWPYVSCFFRCGNKLLNGNIACGCCFCPRPAVHCAHSSS